MAGLIPTLTKVAGPTGNDLPDAERIQFLAPLNVVHVPAVSSGPSTLKVSLAGVSLPRRDTSFEPGVPGAMSGGQTILMVAPADAPTHIATIAFIPNEGLAASDSSYRTGQAIDCASTGLPVGGVGAAITTQTTGSGGTGDWAAVRDAFVVTLDYDLAAGNRLVWVWGFAGAGAVVPSGVWVFT